MQQKKYSWTHRKCAAARKAHCDRVQSSNYVFQLKSLWFGSWQKNSLESIICCKFFNWNRFASNRLSLEFQHWGLVFICYSVQMFISVWLWNICCCSHWKPFTCAKFREHCASRRRTKKNNAHTFTCSRTKGILSVGRVSMRLLSVHQHHIFVKKKYRLESFIKWIKRMKTYWIKNRFLFFFLDRLFVFFVQNSDSVRVLILFRGWTNINCWQNERYLQKNFRKSI